MTDHYETRCPSCGGSDEQGCYADCPTNTIAALRAENERLRAAGQAIIDFYNGPLEAKRPDIFHRLMVRLNAALEEKP